MSKPLELTIHPPAHPNPKPTTPLYRTNPLFDVYMSWKKARDEEALLGSIKRLNKTELAAEYWAQLHDAQHAMTCEMSAGNQAEQKACSDWMSGSIEKANAIRRFATHPHYFEATEPESGTE